ncbi:MAG: chorismate mutase/prephenate dehydratase [uncultured bacterium]|nr:MAG: chorismate mutase/prephenate dehydratase [uncultured bacterium]OGJ47286.1 MAG: hypothetical protein A2244_00375 [Candidatus Peregrinibacteria bacterium RIFOXYA2_FULL_41_18]OGJ48410.1 MAG: hypothetical protein A2344_05420 [Candidatus Peregrinibacteria bacterium RIFOXYB12_FULL_41_12]OGJ52561.1 MAG: hypothetical protein A2448_03415 [Candidatus Peregrinibacteria bacterium RIFOXYC2_FULL_41_22]OGJ53752.1 MAG: hypothetical protein A2336_01915 [Candidatus Peregrinibacteria bacterium RIFOXYB2_FU
MKIDLLRQKIDKIDAKLVELIGKRFYISEQIGVIKKREGVKVFDKKREGDVMKSVEGLAKKVGIGEKVIEKIYKIILVESRKRQG